MSGVLQSTFIIIFYVEIIIGYLGNGFIALVNFMDWIQSRSISTVDQILSALAVSRIGVLCTGLLGILTLGVDPELLTPISRIRVINIAWIVTNHFNLWLSTSLSIFYFLKIANFSTRLLPYLEWRVKKVVSGVLLVSLLFLFLNIALADKHTGVLNDASQKNTSYSSGMRNSGQIFKTLIFMNCLFSFIPFIVSLANFLLLIFSMRRHLKKMQHKMKGSMDVSTTAHIKALKIGLASLLLYALFFLSLIIQTASFEFLDVNFILLYDQVSGLTFPSGHSFVLILGNSKLRQASLSVLRRLRYQRCEVLRSIEH